MGNFIHAILASTLLASMPVAAEEADGATKPHWPMNDLARELGVECMEWCAWNSV